MLGSVLNSSGQFFVCGRFICFYAHIFGSSTKKLYPLDSLLGVSIRGKRELLLETHKKPVVFLFEEKVEEIATFIDRLRTAVMASSTPTPASSSSSSSISLSSMSTLAVPSSPSISGSGSMNEGRGPVSDRSVRELFTMSTKDWKLIMKGAELVRFRKGDLIRRQGDTQNRLMQLSKGTASVELTSSSGANKTTVAHLQAGAIVGEISYLQNGPVTASVVADDDEVLVYVIDGRYLDLLYVVQPALASRFFFYLASIVQERIK
jgi:hypothetical protein